MPTTIARARRFPVGYVEVSDQAVVVKRLFGRTTIPLRRISSVGYSIFGGPNGTLRVETGSERHSLQLWWGRSRKRIQAAIETAISVPAAS